MSAVAGVALKSLQDRIKSGLIFMASAYISDFISERFVRRYLGEYAELGVGVAIPVAVDMIGYGRALAGVEPYLADIIDGMVDYGFYKSVLEAKILKAPKCWFKDANTIQCINFDADAVSTTAVAVYIDDAAQTVSAVQGTPASFTISLSAPAAKGTRKLLVTAGSAKRDAFRGKVYVP